MAGFVLAKTTRIAHSCLVNIAEDIRKYHVKQGIAQDETLKRGRDEKSQEFVETGGEAYAKAPV